MSQYIKEKLIKTGPITVGICGTQNRFLFYAHGIFDDALCCATQNHAMLLTGFGEDEKTGLKYWNLMNRYECGITNWNRWCIFMSLFQNVLVGVVSGEKMGLCVFYGKNNEDYCYSEMICFNFEDFYL